MLRSIEQWNMTVGELCFFKDIPVKGRYSSVFSSHCFPHVYEHAYDEEIQNAMLFVLTTLCYSTSGSRNTTGGIKYVSLHLNNKSFQVIIASPSLPFNVSSRSISKSFEVRPSDISVGISFFISRHFCSDH